MVEHIRKGTLDFVLLKPADAQFLVSTARIQPWRAINVLTALGIFVWAFRLLGDDRRPAIAAAGVALLAAVVVLYSLWIAGGERGVLRRAHRQPDPPLRLGLRRRALARDHLPRRGALRLHVRHPARAHDDLPGAGAARHAARATLSAAVFGAVAAFAVARVVWKASIARYTSAGG